MLGNVKRIKLTQQQHLRITLNLTTDIAWSVAKRLCLMAV